MLECQGFGAGAALVARLVLPAFTMQHTREFNGHRVLPNTIVPDKEIGMWQSIRVQSSQQELFYRFLSYDARPHYVLLLKGMPDPKM
jgi:hypothetical protein